MVNYKELVEFIVRHLVTQPDAISVESGEEEGGIKVMPTRTWGASLESAAPRSTPSGFWPKRLPLKPASVWTSIS